MAAAKANARDREVGGGGQQPMLEASSGSALVERLLHLWARGSISAPTVQFLAEGAVRDGSSNPSLVALSKIGSGGIHTQSAQRDLARKFFFGGGSIRSFHLRTL